MAEDPADVDDVDVDVDDQMAREGMAQIVEADPAIVALEPRADGRARELVTNVNDAAGEVDVVPAQPSTSKSRMPV